MSEEQWRVFQSVRSQKPTDASFMEGQQQQQQGEDKMASLFDLIRKWEDNFSKHLQILLDALNHYAATETVVLLSLCARLSTANAGSGYTGRGEYGQGQVDGVGVQNGGGGMEGGDVRMGGV